MATAYPPVSTSVHFKPTDSHSYLLHSSSNPSHVKNPIPFSQFLRLRRLCSDDADFSNIPVCISNLQIPTVICYIHPLILPTSKTLSRSPNFLGFNVYVVMTPIFPTNQRKCAISSRSVAILILLSTRLNTVLNRLIDSRYCKRHRRKRMREFHLHSLTIHHVHITSQPKTSF